MQQTFIWLSSVLVTLLLFPQQSFSQLTCDREIIIDDPIETFPFVPDATVRADVVDGHRKLAACVDVAQAGFYTLSPSVNYSIGQHNETFFFQVCDENGQNCSFGCEPNAIPLKVIEDPGDTFDDVVKRDGGVFYFPQGKSRLNMIHLAAVLNDFTQFLNDDSLAGSESVHMVELEFEAVSRSYDVSIQEEASPVDVHAGDQFNYTLRVSNSNTNTTFGVEITDVLSDQVFFVSASIEPESTNGNSLFWQFDSLLAGETRTIQITVQATNSPPSLPFDLENRVTVEAICDLNSANNEDASVVTIQPIRNDLMLQKTASLDSVQESSSFQYDINVTNQGPDPAENILLLDVKPAGLFLANFSTAPSRTIGDSLFWNLGTLTRGQSLTITYEATVADDVPAAPVDLINRASVSTANDVDLSNNNSQATVLVIPQDDCLYLDRNVFRPENEAPLQLIFELQTSREVRVDVFDVSGYKLTQLGYQVFPAGANTISWDGTNQNGERVGSGTYLLTFKSGGLVCYKKVILVR